MHASSDRHPSQDAVAKTVRNLLDSIKASLAEGPDVDTLSVPDADRLTPEVRENVTTVVEHVRTHPDLLAVLDGQHRLMAINFLSSYTARYLSEEGRDTAEARQGSYRTITRLRNSIAHGLNTDFDFSAAIDLLGGARLFKHQPESRADVHATIVRGMPYATLLFLTDHAKLLSEEDVAGVIGISTRTLRRQKEAPKKAMPADLASRTWLFAETLAKASEVFGGREEAERWMSTEVMGLDGARPIDLLRTLQGAELVKEFLGRLEHGVYN